MTLVIAALCLTIAAAAQRPARRRNAMPVSSEASAAWWTDPLASLWQRLNGGRSHRRLIGSLPELVELIARGLRGGANLQWALADAAGGDTPAAVSLRPVLERIRQGERLGDAIDRWAGELAHPDADVVRAVLRLGDQTGGALAAPLDRAASTLRERAALDDEIRALTAQTRASSLVVALAPLGFLGVVATVDPESADVLLTTPLGVACLITGLALDGIGIFWMSRIAAGVAQ